MDFQWRLKISVQLILLFIGYLTGTSNGCTEGDVQLVGGSSALEGRVEICKNNTWGTVCHSHWDKPDARVVCRQLGLSESGSIPTLHSHFGEGTGPIQYNLVTCFGTEAALVNCSSGSTFGCTHAHDAGVICHIQTDCEDGDIRLLGGSSPLEGRVEVCYSGVWGTVCDNQWTNADAAVTCRQLGYSTSGAFPIPGAAYGQGNEPTLLDFVRCSGLEPTLLDCVHSGLEIENCGHNKDAGVVCVEGCTAGEVRLVGGNSSMEGRVEICMNDEWGTVCDQMWDEADAGVVCRQLGLNPAEAQFFGQASFGEGTGRTWLNNVTCTGNERELGSCTASSSEDNSCIHAQDAGVRCSPGCYEGDVRLVDGATGLEGRLEICRNNVWGTVCSNYWDHNDAKVVCRKLGLSAVGSTPLHNAAFGQGSGPIHYDFFRCSGSESKLVECPLSTQTSGCDHGRDAGVRCLEQTGCEDGDIRLVGGATALEGRVEMCYSGVWGTVCSNEWGAADAAVTCRQLGYPKAAPRSDAVFGQGSGPILLDLVRCNGLENALFDCGRGRGIEPYSCRHHQDAGVVCAEGCTTGEVRLVSGNSSFEGRVEICLNDEWGTVCDQMWDKADAGVVCRQLGLNLAGLEALTQASFGEGTGRIWLDGVTCTGEERELVNCPASFSGANSCTHAQDAAVRCSSGCTEREVRLVGGASRLEGRVEVCEGNEWGTICQHHWDRLEGRVVCRELGYSASGTAIFHNAAFGDGVGMPIHYGRIDCGGEETQLSQCHRGTLDGCTHAHDAGVRCLEKIDCEDGEIRLVGGATALEGRVEMCYSGGWGGVCDNEWGPADAAVTCRQLGYSSSGATPRINEAHGGGPVLLDLVRCNGLENALFDCGRGYGIHLEPGNCRRYRHLAAGVVCLQGCTTGEVRLVGGNSSFEGRVEICLNDEWGTVCDQMWDEADAGVVCRQLGLNLAGVEALTQASFGEGTGRIWLDGVTCTGEERELVNCPASFGGANSCTHAQDAAVRCLSGCTEGEVRLVEGFSRLEGRVEFCKGSQWGIICQTNWENQDARVVCRQLGYSVAGSIALHNSVFGQVAPVTPIHHGHVYCTGDESKLAECSLGSSHGCHSNQNAGVRCHGKTDCEDGDIRLLGGSSPLEGRVEVCYSGVWGTVCDNQWTNADAAVTCRQLGYSSSGVVPRGGAAYGPGSGPVFLDSLWCNGMENRLFDCAYRGRLESTHCGHGQDAGVVCVEGCTTGELRLVGGNSSFEGRVEICLNDEWGTVCDQMWDETDTGVVCRQLGFGPSGLEAFSQAWFGEGRGRIWLDSVACAGSERKLKDCTTGSNGDNSCTHAQDAGVRCSPGCIEGDIRLADGSDELEGRVEICRQNEWGTVCHNNWDTPDATVVCRQLGHSVAGSLPYSNANFGQGIGPVQFSYSQCTGSEGRLVDCPSGSVGGCNHDHDAGVRCQMKTGCSNGDIRLVGGNTTLEGRVEVCYSGVWGTVCDDQWDEASANVTCRQLGHSTRGATPRYGSAFGQGIGTILLDDVNCNGEERRLFDCIHAGIEVHNCDHSQDAGVVCSELIFRPSENPVRLDPTSVDGSCALNESLVSTKEAIEQYLQRKYS